MALSILLDDRIAAPKTSDLYFIGGGGRHYDLLNVRMNGRQVTLLVSHPIVRGSAAARSIPDDQLRVFLPALRALQSKQDDFRLQDAGGASIESLSESDTAGYHERGHTIEALRNQLERI